MKTDDVIAANPFTKSLFLGAILGLFWAIAIILLPEPSPASPPYDAKIYAVVPVVGNTEVLQEKLNIKFHEGYDIITATRSHVFMKRRGWTTAR